MKIDRKKKVKPHDTTKVSLIPFNQIESPQIVSSSFILNLNNEFAWIYC